MELKAFQKSIYVRHVTSFVGLASQVLPVALEFVMWHFVVVEKPLG